MAGQGGVLQAGQQGIGLAFDETTCDEFVARVRDSGLVSEEQVGDGELRSIFDGACLGFLRPPPPPTLPQPHALSVVGSEPSRDLPGPPARSGSML